MNGYINIDSLVAKLNNYFEDKHFISAVYLFGSVVKGKNRKNSDVDIGVLFDEGIDNIQRFEYKLDMTNELEDLLGKKADVVDLESADLFFINQFLSNNKLILENDLHRRVEFEVKSRREYFDRLPFYKLYHKQAMSRLERRQ
jgi:hypothetical protein